jgi:hypothetical protein
LTEQILWASTTVVPEGEPARFAGDETRYNVVADRVMRQHDVRTHDLHALTASFAPDMFLAPRDVHYSSAGSARIAEQVAAAIKAALVDGPATKAERESPR